MRADFIEAHADGQKQIDYIVTDDGERLGLSSRFTAKWVTTADSLYRCILYYNKVEQQGQYIAEPVSVGLVPCLRPIALSQLDIEMKTDPVRFESVWTSKSGKYLNLGLYLMTGTTSDSEATQRLRMVCDTVIVNPDQTRTCHLRLCHDQGGVPEYYSTPVYISISAADIPADSVSISVNTYQGFFSKVIPFP